MTAKQPTDHEVKLQAYTMRYEAALAAEAEARARFRVERTDTARRLREMAVRQTLDFWRQLVDEQAISHNAQGRAQGPRAKDPVREKVIGIFRTFRAADRRMSEALAAMQADTHNGLTVAYVSSGNYRIEDEDAPDASVKVCGGKALEAMWTEAAKPKRS